jgi:hypothetical protein
VEVNVFELGKRKPYPETAPGTVFAFGPVRDHHIHSTFVKFGILNDLIIISSVRTDLGDLSSGGRFHERAAQYLQGIRPNVISRFNNGLSVF